MSGKREARAEIDLVKTIRRRALLLSELSRLGISAMYLQFATLQKRFDTTFISSAALITIFQVV